MVNEPKLRTMSCTQNCTNMYEYRRTFQISLLSILRGGRVYVSAASAGPKKGSQGSAMSFLLVMGWLDSGSRGSFSRSGLHFQEVDYTFTMEKWTTLSRRGLHFQKKANYTFKKRTTLSRSGLHFQEVDYTFKNWTTLSRSGPHFHDGEVDYTSEK